MSILLCHIAFSYFATLFVMLYFAFVLLKKRTIITPYILLFTLVFHYADVTLCMTLAARILILVTSRNCVCVTISGHEPFRANFLFNVKSTWRMIQKIVNRALRLLREAKDVFAQTNKNVDTSSIQSTSTVA